MAILQTLAARVEADDAYLSLARGDDGLQRAERHFIVHGEDPDDVGMSLQQILSDRLGLFAFGLPARQQQSTNAGRDLSGKRRQRAPSRGRGETIAGLSITKTSPFLLSRSTIFFAAISPPWWLSEAM